MDVLRSLNAFTTHMDVPNYPVSYYSIVRRGLDIVKSAAYVAMTIVCDALIVSTVIMNFLSILKKAFFWLSVAIATGLSYFYRLGPKRGPRSISHAPHRR